MDITLGIELAVFIILMGFSAFFSSSETALFSLSPTQLEQLRREKRPRADLITRMLSEPRRLIVTILIGNELVNVAASTLSAAVIIQLYGAENKLINLLVMIPLLLLFGEITPKTLAIRNNMAFAALQAQPIHLFAQMVAPIRWLVRRIADLFITLVVGRERSEGNIITEDMVRTLAREAVGEGVLDAAEAQLIDQIFDFGNITLAEIMTPRSHTITLSIDLSMGELIAELPKSRHTKIPMHGTTTDDVLGILHVRDLLSIDPATFEAEGGDLRTLLRDAYFVPESKSAADLFHTFRERKLSIALTVDEYGGVTGLVTMEDLLETIFGDIPSPSDIRETGTIEALEAHRYQVDGSTSLRELNERLHLALPDELADTVGGLVLHEHGELPDEDSTVELHGIRFRVVEMDKTRIVRLEVEVLAEARRGEGSLVTQVQAGSVSSSVSSSISSSVSQLDPDGEEVL